MLVTKQAVFKRFWYPVIPTVELSGEPKASDIIAFNRAVTLEDKQILETTDWDVPLDIAQEQQMMTDKPGIIIRRKIAALLKAHGEIEQTQFSSQ
ncbi:hypothetical protein QUA56_23715 [Microcoleus sp. N3A4]|uniref:hypothetical protein n=1 Tax=Microcoleus sp. N3A4 TaxID=3055379 RepID=UPI002FD43070